MCAWEVQSTASSTAVGDMDAITARPEPIMLTATVSPFPATSHPPHKTNAIPSPLCVLAKKQHILCLTKPSKHALNQASTAATPLSHSQRAMYHTASGPLPTTQRHTPPRTHTHTHPGHGTLLLPVHLLGAAPQYQSPAWHCTSPHETPQ